MQGMKPGLELELDIAAIAYGGAGLARHEGRVIFVPFTIPGEKVRARIAEVHRGWSRARVAEILQPSPDRIEPPCPWFGRCGGCAYQHIAYPRQLEIKTVQVAETLRRIGKFADPPVEPALPSPLVYGYRNRITVHVDPPLVGFRGVDPRQLVDLGKCLLADGAVNDALTRLRTKKHPHPGPATLRHDTGGRGFRQVNDGAAEFLAGVVAQMGGSGSCLVDAYCGSGFFARKMRAQFERIIGIDWDERAIESARRSAGPNESYLAGDSAGLLPEVLASAPDDTVVLLDPPAQGLAEQVVQTLRDLRPGRVIYVSCDPPTFARDAAKLSGVYDLRRVAPVDMFPQTASIEIAALLEKVRG